MIYWRVPCGARLFFVLGVFLDFSVFFPIISILGVAFVLGDAYIDLEKINLTNEKGYFTMTTYPYNASGDAHLIAIIDKLKNVFPKEISIETIKKYGIANKGESHIIKTLKFINLIDESGIVVPESKALFMTKGESFQLGFSEVIKGVYGDLFDLHGDDSWNLDDGDLLSFFKVTDGASDITARRQAQTFKVFAEISGKREPQSNRTAQVKSPTPIKTNKPKQATPKINAPKSAPIITPTEKLQLTPSGNFALSVRIEVNLPAGGTKENYDNIFKSIRENLINE